MNPSAQVRVTNRNNAYVIKDRYGAQDYTFPPGESVLVSADVAEHIFGYGLDEKGRWQKFLRMGLGNHPKGKEMWARVEVKPVGNIEATGKTRVAAA